MAQRLEKGLQRSTLADRLAESPIADMIASTELDLRLWRPTGARSRQPRGIEPRASLPVDEEVHAQVAEALVGAYYLSEGIFSADRFLMWQAGASAVQSSFEISSSSSQRSSRQRLAVVGFYCNACEHRSVCMAEAFERLLDKLDVSSEIRHVCDSCWCQKYCMGCGECRRSTNTPAGRMMQAAVLEMD